MTKPKMTFCEIDADITITDDKGYGVFLNKPDFMMIDNQGITLILDDTDNVNLYRHGFTIKVDPK